MDFKITVRQSGQKFLHELFVDGNFQYARKTTKIYNYGAVAYYEPESRYRIWSMRTDPDKFEQYVYCGGSSSTDYKIVKVTR
jgi:hypothetical protein